MTPAPALDPAADPPLRFTPCQVRAARVPRARAPGPRRGRRGLGQDLDGARARAPGARRAGAPRCCCAGGRTHAAWLRERLGEGAPGVRAESFLELCRSVTLAAGGDFAEPGAPDARREFLGMGRLGAVARTRRRHRRALRGDRRGRRAGLPGRLVGRAARVPGTRRGASTCSTTRRRTSTARAASGRWSRCRASSSSSAAAARVAVPEIVATLPDAHRRRAAIEALAADWTRGARPAARARRDPVAVRRASATCLADAGSLAGLPLTSAASLAGARARACWSAPSGRSAVSRPTRWRSSTCPGPAGTGASGAPTCTWGRSRARRLLHVFAAEPQGGVRSAALR